MTIKEEIIEYLKGSYTETGIEKWFNRPRSALKGRTPSDILKAFTMKVPYVLLTPILGVWLIKKL